MKASISFSSLGLPFVVGFLEDRDEYFLLFRVASCGWFL